MVHTHDAADVDSGVLGIGRIPVGPAAALVAAGDHDHDDRYSRVGDTRVLSPVSVGAVGGPDDTVVLQQTLDRLYEHPGPGVMDLGGRTHSVRGLVLRPQLGIVNGTLRLVGDPPGGYLVTLAGHVNDPPILRQGSWPQRDWLLDRLVLDGNKANNPGMAGVIRTGEQHGGQIDRPLIRDVRIENARGTIINLAAEHPGGPFVIQPRLEHVTIDCLEGFTDTVGLAIGPGAFDTSCIAVDIGRCTTGVLIGGTAKHRFTDVRAWGCQDVGLRCSDSRDITFVNCEFDNNFGDGARFENSTSIHCVASAFTNSAFVDVSGDFGYGTPYSVAAAGERDGAVLTQGSVVYFTACRLGNEGNGGEQGYGITTDGGSTAVLSPDCVFRDHRHGEHDGPHIGLLGVDFGNGAHLIAQADDRFDVGFDSDQGAGLELYRFTGGRSGQLRMVFGGAGRVSFVRSANGMFDEMLALLPDGGLQLAASTQEPATPADGGVLFVRNGRLCFTGPDGVVTALTP